MVHKCFLKRRRDLSIFLFAASLLDASFAQEQCTICKDGANVQFPEKELVIPGYEFLRNCEMLANALPQVLTQDTDECNAIQSVGSYCGCPIAEDACQLCDEILQYPDHELPMFQDDFGGVFMPTCGLMEAYLQGSANGNDDSCTVGRTFLHDYCGCSSPESVPPSKPCTLCPEGSINFPDKTLNLPAFPFSTCQELADGVQLLLQDGTDQCNLMQMLGGICGCSRPEKSCQLCASGGPIKNPEHQLPMFAPVLGHITPTCEIMEAAVAYLYDTQSEDCMLSQALAGGPCGCEAINNSCHMCPGEELEDEFRDVRLDSLAFFAEMDFPVTCDYGFSTSTQILKDSSFCHLLQYRNDLCGCNGGERVYSSADTLTKKAALSWAPRVSALLSLLGSSAIICDVLRSVQKRSELYNQLMLGMAVFDVLSSIAWMASTSVFPVEDEFGEPTKIYGANGSNVTCSMQGFFLQLGFASVFYNASITLYYFLCICWSWRQRQLRKIRLWMHVVPILMGVALASGGIPYYRLNNVVCYIGTREHLGSLLPAAILCYVPIFVVLFLTAMCMTLIIVKVNMLIRRSRRWSMTSLAYSASQSTSGGSDDGVLSFRSDRRVQQSPMERIRREVMWNTIFYLLAFWISYPVLWALHYYSSHIYSYWPWLFLVILAPIQGLNNALIYFRHRIFGWVQSPNKCSWRCSVQMWGRPHSHENVTNEGMIRLEEIVVSNDTTDNMEAENTNSGEVDIADPSVVIASDDPPNAMIFQPPRSIRSRKVSRKPSRVASRTASLSPVRVPSIGASRVASKILPKIPSRMPSRKFSHKHDEAVETAPLDGTVTTTNSSETGRITCDEMVGGLPSEGAAGIRDSAPNEISLDFEEQGDSKSQAKCLLLPSEIDTRPAPDDPLPFRRAIR